MLKIKFFTLMHTYLIAEKTTIFQGYRNKYNWQSCPSGSFNLCEIYCLQRSLILAHLKDFFINSLKPSHEFEILLFDQGRTYFLNTSKFTINNIIPISIALKLKVQLFWEGHKIWKKISHLFWCYWVKTAVLSKQVGDFFSNFVAFS